MKFPQWCVLQAKACYTKLHAMTFFPTQTLAPPLLSMSPLLFPNPHNQYTLLLHVYVQFKVMQMLSSLQLWWPNCCRFNLWVFLALLLQTHECCYYYKCQWLKEHGLFFPNSSLVWNVHYMWNLSQSFYL